MNICELFTIVVYNAPTYSTVSQELIEYTIDITSSTAMCGSYITTINTSPEIPTGVPSEGEVVGLPFKR